MIRNIPRKPHPNGLLVYGVDCYTAVQKYPLLIDFHAHLPDQRLSARKALQKLARRLRKNHPTIAPHLIVDSAFGSLKNLEYLRSIDVNATMSMSQNSIKWLWSALEWDYSPNTGRTVTLAIPGHNERLVASLYQRAEPGRPPANLRTLSSGFSFTRPPSSEHRVLKILSRDKRNPKRWLYDTLWDDQSTTWEPSTSFLDANGVVSFPWLEFADLDDVVAALKIFEKKALSAMCEKLNISVLIFFSVTLKLISLGFCKKLDSTTGEYCTNDFEAEG